MIVVDVETSGLDPTRHAILSLRTVEFLYIKTDKLIIADFSLSPYPVG